jgi:hypothetical protein
MMFHLEGAANFEDFVAYSFLKSAVAMTPGIVTIQNPSVPPPLITVFKVSPDGLYGVTHSNHAMP